MSAALPVLSLLLLAAHALRPGDWALATVFLVFAGAVFSRREWLRPVLFAVMAAGCLLWAQSGAGFVRMRLALGQPWLRLALILGAVLALTAVSAALLLTPRARAWFRRTTPQDAARTGAFLVTAAALVLARRMSPLPVLLADRFLPGAGALEILALSWYAAWACGLLVAARDTARLRLRFWLGFSAVFFGQLLLGLLLDQRFLMTGKLHLPVPALIVAGPLYRGEGFFMPILFAASVLVLGPAWCSWLCYVGAWDGLCAARARTTAPQRLEASARVRRWTVAGRGLTLVLAVVLALLLRAMGIPGYQALWGAALFGLAGVGIMVMLSRRAGVMVHCATFCPMGLVANCLGRINPLRLRLGPGCTRCGACAARCRYAALLPADIEQGRPGLSCTLCGDCLGACGHGCLGYRLPGLSPQAARTVFIVLAVGLHAAFLGVARI
jgi:ferredoxin